MPHPNDLVGLLHQQIKRREQEVAELKAELKMAQESIEMLKGMLEEADDRRDS